jgi:hypothetical protein
LIRELRLYEAVKHEELSGDFYTSLLEGRA